MRSNRGSAEARGILVMKPTIPGIRKLTQLTRKERRGGADAAPQPEEVIRGSKIGAGGRI